MAVEVRNSDAALEPGVPQPLFPEHPSNVLDVGFLPRVSIIRGIELI
jgi:hypothetical protein